MGFVVIYKNKEKGVKITMTNDLRSFVYIDYPRNIAKLFNIEDLVSMMRNNTDNPPMKIGDLKNNVIFKKHM